MLDRNGKELHVGDRVRWGSGLDLVHGVVRTIRPSPHRPEIEECSADNGNPTNDDIATNGWTCLVVLASKEVTLTRTAMSDEEKERRDRAELARLKALYPEER